MNFLFKKYISEYTLSLFGMFIGSVVALFISPVSGVIKKIQSKSNDSIQNIFLFF